MVRLLHLDVVGDHGSAVNEVGGYGVMFTLCMIVLSLSIMSMVIFACGDFGDPSRNPPKKRRNRYRGDGGGADFGGGDRGADFSGGDGGGGCGGGGGGGGSDFGGGGGCGGGGGGGGCGGGGTAGC